MTQAVIREFLLESSIELSQGGTPRDAVLHGEILSFDANPGGIRHKIRHAECGRRIPNVKTPTATRGPRCWYRFT